MRSDILWIKFYKVKDILFYLLNFTEETKTVANKILKVSYTEKKSGTEKETGRKNITSRNKKVLQSL